jgi:hypothetical protein
LILNARQIVGAGVDYLPGDQPPIVNSGNGFQVTALPEGVAATVAAPKVEYKGVAY